MNTPKPNWPLLGFWRFFLAFIVVVSHLFAIWHGEFPGSRLLNQLGADDAVLCFLLLSGFSIGYSIKERPDGFIVRRFWRIYPVYITCFVLSLLPFFVWASVQKTPGGYDLRLPTPLQLVTHVLLLQPLLTKSFRIFSPSWTLGVEWLFYMLAPLLLRLSKVAMLALIGTSAIFYAIMVTRVSFTEISGSIPHLSLLWVWLLGFYVVLFPHKLAPFLIACLPLAIIPRYGSAPLGPILWVATVCLIFLGHKINLAKWASLAAQKMGDVSYSLYLIHVAAFTYCFNLFHSGNGVVLTAFALTMAAAIHMGIELPFSRYRRAFVKNRAEVSVAV